VLATDLPEVVVAIVIETVIEDMMSEYRPVDELTASFTPRP